ncbi:MAG: ATP-binding cassette domain-containing protein [Acidimicrobiia bacterium]|nr:ATP-binding cassette domain-containing protein [Acidimicrobiia bacterium]
MAPAIVAESLVKTYGDVVALDGFDLEVQPGTVTGLLGPNGAGKTTAVRVFTTLLKPDSGTATVLGLDALTQASALRERIGLSGQYAAVDEDLTGFENLDMVGRLYHLGKQESRLRARQLLERFDLSDAGDRSVKGYSGGMRRRLDLAGALVAKPQVLFLDEPTTGLDPRSRLAMWDVIGELVADGTTLLLTTQYLEEADRLADNIVVIDHGKVIAEGTATELKVQVGGEHLEVTVGDASHLSTAVTELGHIGRGAVTTDEVGLRVSVPIDAHPKLLIEVLRKLDAASVDVTDIGLRRPTLDDVFLTLTGHPAEEDSSQEISA